MTTYHDDVSDDQSENLKRIVDFHNSEDERLGFQCPLQRYETTQKPMGCEVLYVSQTGMEIADEDCRRHLRSIRASSTEARKMDRFIFSQ